jgi:plasmid stability protein
MAQLLVRNIDEQVVHRLKDRARRHDRSLQSEARIILSQAVGLGFEEAREVVRSWQKRLSGRKFPDTVQMVREDRKR